MALLLPGQRSFTIRRTRVSQRRGAWLSRANRRVQRPSLMVAFLWLAADSEVEVVL